MSMLINIAEVVLGIVSFMLVWIIYPYSFSLFELYRVSILSIFLNRFFFSLLAGMVGYVAALFYFEPDQLKKFEQATQSKPADTVIKENNVLPVAPNVLPVVKSKDHEVPPPLTAEQIEEAEIKAQYRGDDPIVRKRLGLPPKIIHSEEKTNNIATD